MRVSVEKQTDWAFGFVWYFLTPVVLSLCVGSLLIAATYNPEKEKRNSLTCYNSAFEISYMSPPNAVIGSRPSQYGVWTLEDGTYVQNSGETCIVEKAQVEVQK